MADTINKFYVNIGEKSKKKYLMEISPLRTISLTEIHLILYSIHVQLKRLTNIFLI